MKYLAGHRPDIGPPDDRDWTDEAVAYRIDIAARELDQCSARLNIIASMIISGATAPVIAQYEIPRLTDRIRHVIDDIMAIHNHELLLREALRVEDHR